MSRSLRVLHNYIETVKLAVKRNGFARQKDLAEDLQMSLATISNFLNGKPVDYLNFLEISARLGQDWKEIADFEQNDNYHSSLNLEILPEETTPERFQEQSEAAFFHYIERPPIESRCYETILQPGSLLRIKAPKRMGKTWLLDNIIHQARIQNYRIVRLNLLQANEAVLEKGLDIFLRWFCAVMSRQLRRPDQIANYWEEGLGSSYNCTVYFEEHLLVQLDRPLVLALDEVERVFPYPNIAKDFFGLLRAWHEEAKSRTVWRNLRLIIAHATEVYIPLNINQSPFNVGVPIELPEFSQAQVEELGKYQGLNWDTSQVQQLMNLVGGHPYLVQRAIYQLVRSEITLEKFLQTAPTESGIYSDHLRGHLSNLKEYPELAAAMKKVVDSNQSNTIDPMLAFKLQSLGLVQLNDNRLLPRCSLYSQYFQTHLSSY
jgi:transcriptional regulator with XRE-family HTH domain